jgi:hypothetical protein
MYCTSSFLVPALLTTLLVAGSAYADVEPVIEWQASLSSCFPEDLVLDEAGRTYVACRDSSARAVRLLAYARDGSLITQTTLAVGLSADALPIDLAWASGQLYVAVTSRRATASEAVLYALSTPDLRERWRDAQASAAAASLATTADGGVWLGATATGTTADILLTSYGAAGDIEVDVRYDSGKDDLLGGQKRSLAVDAGGDLYVAANTALLRFERDGSLAWRIEQPSYAVAVDTHDHALVTTPLGPDGQTARFTPDGHRDFLIMTGGFHLAMAPSGQIWIGGTRVVQSARDWDVLTTLLAADGRVVFTDRYDGGNQDRFVDLGIDATGAAYVLASSHVRSGLLGTTDSYLVLKYTAGERRVWTESYGRSGLPKALGVSAEGRFVATGYEATASWVQEEPEDCPWWWPGCWFRS